jgi:hypothetical protein
MSKVFLTKEQVEKAYPGIYAKIETLDEIALRKAMNGYCVPDLCYSKAFSQAAEYSLSMDNLNRKLNKGEINHDELRKLEESVITPIAIKCTMELHRSNDAAMKNLLLCRGVALAVENETTDNPNAHRLTNGMKKYDEAVKTAFVIAELF